MRGCAIAPAEDAEGRRLAILAVLDAKPRAWTPADAEALEEHAGLLAQLVAMGGPRLAQTHRPVENARAEDLRRTKLGADAASRAKSAFLANMSHEMRTPMTAILGYTQLLQRDPEVGVAQQVHLEVISRNGERLLELINDALEMSRIELGHRNVSREELDLGGLLDDMERVFRARAEARQLTFALSRALDLPGHIVTDGSKLRRVLVNLLDNAVKFTVSGGVAVRALARPPGPTGGATRLIVEVEDTGPGIGAEEMADLFRPFIHTRKGIAAGGTGLGLALSRELSLLMGGNITVDSRPGKGSLFRLELPFEIGSAPASRRQAPMGRVLRVVGAPGQVRVVSVSDDREASVWMETLLAQVGFDVRAPRDGATAPALVETFCPHLVLLDVGQAASDTVRALRAEPAGRRAAVVVLTSGTLEGARDALTEADGVLFKPCRERDLLDEIQKQLGIDYTYADPPPAQVSRIPELLATPRQHLARLPAALVRDLRTAAHVADYERLRELVAQVPVEHEAVSAALFELVDQYAYEQLEAILQPA